MKSIDEIRRNNAKAILDEHFAGSRAAMGAALDVSGPFVGRLLNAGSPQSRNIGDALAQKIERVAGKPKHWLDHEHSEQSDSFENFANYWAKAPIQNREAAKILLGAPTAITFEASTLNAINGALALATSMIEASAKQKSDSPGSVAQGQAMKALAASSKNKKQEKVGYGQEASGVPTADSGNAIARSGAAGRKRG